jgi:hypothetical protein
MQGMDQKKFRFNDVVPIVITGPENSSSVLVVIQADANGFTSQLVNATTGAPLAGTVSRLYGALTGQFETQAMFYNQYYMDNVHFDLTLTQGGAAYSISPIVT